MEFFSRPDLWIAFLTLFALEIVLGVDNVVFISILSDKLPPQLRRRARIVGLSLAMIFRIALLFVASWAALALAASYVAATSVNDIADADVDRINHPGDRARPLVTGDASEERIRKLVHTAHE